MLFITNRIPKEGRMSEEGRAFTFDLTVTAPSADMFFCERIDGDMNIELMGRPFMSRIREYDCKQILLYIHGFNNLPDIVFKNAALLQKLCDAETPGEVLVVPFIWPCDNDVGIVLDYWDDQGAADLSGASGARVIERFMEWRDSPANEPATAPCLKRISILAHSMGNRVLRRSLRTWEQRYGGHGMPQLFRCVFMVAADVVNETLHRGQEGEIICHSAANVVVYHAKDDLALRSSKVANLKNRVASRRLGHTGVERIKKAPKNVYEVDCGRFNNGYDPPTGHTYFGINPKTGRAGLLFKHMFECLGSGMIFPDDDNRRQKTLK